MVDHICGRPSWWPTITMVDLHDGRLSWCVRHHDGRPSWRSIIMMVYRHDGRPSWWSTVMMLGIFFENFQKASPRKFFGLGRSFLQNRPKRVFPKFHADRSYPRGVNVLPKFSNFSKNWPPQKFLASENHFCKISRNAFSQSFTPIGAILGG